MLTGILRREPTLEELRERERKATVSAKFLIDPALWAVSTIFFIVLPYAVWQTTHYMEFVFFCTGTYIAMIFAVWAGKKFISVTFLRWYTTWHEVQLDKELYNKLYFLAKNKYGYTNREAHVYAKETMECSINSILEMIEYEERKR
ncbi:hypothetical protein A2572_03590 [Candidatus Collierbacteria bacterium RIFOXYD1_FULL_40_9]|uniref:Uncharacterized protein n=1 Tax=Candidatus Collierbacteria bacterium RIFOXYD1_FULL_40_9 TaxID=1817731 RepID=A0A1F5FTM7_9BACT|nr:MAG: hypothetical protein A2572_03590 [Candidatus Collierbacteria bacterium RIFOXYD1_FULL_40_9]